jgi:hypothetical protein
MSASDVYAAAAGGVVHCDGSTWVKTTLPPGVGVPNVHAAWGSGPSDVYIVSESSTLLHHP